MFVFLLHVGSDLSLTDLIASDLRLLLHCLVVSIDLSVGLKDLQRNPVQSSTKDPAEKSPDCQISNGHLLSNIKPCVVVIIIISAFRSEILYQSSHSAPVFSPKLQGTWEVFQSRGRLWPLSSPGDP